MNDLSPWGHRRDFLKAIAAATGSLPLWAQAQSSWPSKPVNMVVPFPAGGGTDAFARPMSAAFAKLTGKQMIIDNRGGAGGTLGAGIAAKNHAGCIASFQQPLPKSSGASHYIGWG